MEFNDFFQVLFTSMLPILEVRGAIPLALAKGFSPAASFFLCSTGNMIPIPFLILLSRKILHWLKKFPKIAKFAQRLEEKAHKKSQIVLKWSFWGLLLLVAIPLPGTGAWTGALVASFIDLRLRNSLIAIYGGVIIASLIVLGISCGVIAAL